MPVGDADKDAGTLGSEKRGPVFEHDISRLLDFSYLQHKLSQFEADGQLPVGVR